MLKIIKNRNIFFILSGTLVLAAILALLVWGLKLGIDFTGGSLVELTFTDNRPSSQAITQVINESELGLDEVKIQPSGTNELIIRTKALSEDEHQALLSLLRDNFGPEQVVENRFESIGPVIGEELKNKAILAIIVALIMVVVYIAYAFRKVSKPVASWKYGLAAIIALAHDILIVTGVFAVLGYLMNIEVGILFVTALLTVLGYSVNDTIVVFDRVRENLIYRPRETFVETINASVNETITRSINTSFTTLLVLFTLYFLGGTTIRDFVLVLILGTIVGTYSSIFIASPILVVWQKLSRRNK
jgi:preprotein translocase subunit SecF